MRKLIEKIKNLIYSKNNCYPHITYSSYTKKRLTESCINDKSIKQYLGLILSKLGVKSDAQIWIGNYETFNKGKGYFVNCYKNNEDNGYLFSLGFDYEDYFSKTPKLIVLNSYKKTTNKYEMSYYEMSYSINNGKEDIILNPIAYEKKLSDGTKYHIAYFGDGAHYKIKNGTNEFSLKITKAINRETTDKDEYGIAKKYKLNNEDKLVEYLVSLNFPVEIDEVYKKICEISLGSDVSEYDFISIYVLMEGKLTDSIEISRGEWQKFCKTKNGKTVVVHQNGCWSYELNDDSSLANLEDELSTDSTVKFSMSFDSKGISYVVNAKSEGEIDDYTNTLAMYDISTARSEVENTKKLVRELIKK